MRNLKKVALICVLALDTTRGEMQHSYIIYLSLNRNDGGSIFMEKKYSAQCACRYIVWACGNIVVLRYHFWYALATNYPGLTHVMR